MKEHLLCSKESLINRLNRFSLSKLGMDDRPQKDPESPPTLKLETDDN